MKLFPNLNKLIVSILYYYILFTKCCYYMYLENSECSDKKINCIKRFFLLFLLVKLMCYNYMYYYTK